MRSLPKNNPKFVPRNMQYKRGASMLLLFVYIYCKKIFFLLAIDGYIHLTEKSKPNKHILNINDLYNASYKKHLPTASFRSIFLLCLHENVERKLL